MPEFVDPINANFQLKPRSPAIDKGVALTEVMDDIGFDHECLKRKSGQKYSWWIYDIDFAYIEQKGGLQNCFNSKNRPVGSAPDLGAFEYSDATTPKKPAALRIVP